MTTPSESGINHPIEWAMESDAEPMFMIADWLVKDTLGTTEDAKTILTSKTTSLGDLKRLKTIFKHLRIEGETTADRRLGARLYATTIASGLVFHEQLISDQSIPRLIQAFIDLEEDGNLPNVIRNVARQATELMPNFA